MYPDRIWDASPQGRRLYLTFDDGPIPEVTPWVLEQLSQFNAKATFFSIGDNVSKHPEIFSQVLAESHAIGNHTHNHLNGWKTSPQQYLENVLKAQDIFLKAGFTVPRDSGMIFRPPYGKMTRKQEKLLTQKNFHIVMWDVLSYDFKEKLAPEKIFKKLTKKSRPGSILVFHDSLKAEKNLRAVLPRILEHYSEKGFLFDKL